MRSLNNRKTHKKLQKCKVYKKKNSRINKSTRSYSHEIPLQNVEDINEIIRIHRTQRTVSKRFWKIMPKDSCEVYKDRRKRQVENERSQNSNERRRSMSEEEDNNVVDKKRKEKKKKREFYKRLKKNKQKRRNHKQRHRCNSSASSICSKSISSYSSSNSEMDYE